MKTPAVRTTATCLLLALSLLGPSLARAQSAAGGGPPQKIDVAWDAVKYLPLGERVRVELKGGRSVKGALQSADDDRVVVTRDGRREELARADVRRVLHLRRRAKKAKYAAIGAGVGAAVGVGIGAAKADPLVDDSELYYPVAITIAAGVGAAVGALVGRGRRHRVLLYESADR